MAVPDPYKAAKPKVNIPVPKSGGAVPAPTSVAAPKSLGVITSSNAVPKPTSTVKSTPGLQPIVSTAGAIPTPPAQNKSAISTPAYTDWLSKSNDNYANLEKLVNTPFAYDPETDPGYQAQRQLAQLRAGDASRNALETANEKGILGSSMNVSQLGQIQQRAEQEAAAYIPEYRNQAYGQYQDRLRSAAELLGQSRNLRGDQFNESVTEAGITGNYLSPNAQAIVSRLNNLKTVTEQNWSTMSAEQRAAARAEGDQLRSQLDGMGIDSTLFGANVTANSAMGNVNKAGTRTIAGQAQDYNQMDRDRNFDYGVGRDERSDFVTDRDFGYTQEQDKLAQDNFMLEFNNLIKQQDFDRALQLAQQRVNESREGRLASGGSGGGSRSSSSSTSKEESNTVKATASEMNSLYTNLLQQYGTADSEGKYKSPTSQQGKQNIINRILDFNLPDDQTENLLRRFNMTVAEAEKILNAPAPKQPELPTREQVTKDLLNFKF